MDLDGFEPQTFFMRWKTTPKLSGTHSEYKQLALSCIKHGPGREESERIGQYGYDMRTSSAGIALALLLSSFVRAQSAYGLPIRVGATSAEVEKVLGKPSETIVVGNDEHAGHAGHAGMSNKSVDHVSVYEWYDSAGIVGTFSEGKLTEIKIFPDTDYPNFVAYAGSIVNDVTLRDVRKTILEKLGRPTKIEDEPIAEGTNPDTPVINPQQSRYFWSMNGFTLQVTVLSQPKLIRQAGPLVIPKDSIIAVIVSK